MHIVITTGFYSRDSWPESFLEMGQAEMEAHMMQEIEKGLEGTDVRPGHVKVAIEEDFSEPEVNALRAGARVARRTGFSMTVHQGMLLKPDAGNQDRGPSRRGGHRTRPRGDRPQRRELRRAAISAS